MFLEKLWRLFCKLLRFLWHYICIIYNFTSDGCAWVMDILLYSIHWLWDTIEGPLINGWRSFAEVIYDTHMVYCEAYGDYLIHGTLFTLFMIVNLWLIAMWDEEYDAYCADCIAKHKVPEEVFYERVPLKIGRFLVLCARKACKAVYWIIFKSPRYLRHDLDWWHVFTFCWYTVNIWWFILFLMFGI